MLQPQWAFDKVSPGTTERNSVSDEFFTNDTRLEAIIRESIQNSLDAQVRVDEPVEVKIYFSGEVDKLPAEKFKKYLNGGEMRFYATKNGLTSPKQTICEDCQFLVIEDFNTTGLTGVVDEKPFIEDVEHRNDWNYYNYFFRENVSTKVGAGTLGSWGAGKCVFQRASRLKMSFAYSVRDGFLPRQFIAGKATLQHYQDDNKVTWAPDGWFGVIVQSDDEYPNKMLKRPIEDTEFIASFKADFNIQRSDQPGMSIVIPHVHLATDSENEGEMFNQSNLVCAVLRNFLVAIHSNKLKVIVQIGKSGEPIVIDKNTFEKYGSFLPEPDGKDALVTTLHHQLIIDALKDDFPNAQKYELCSPGDQPSWKKEMFNDEQLKAMQKNLHEKKPLLVTIPIPVRKKTDGNKVTVKHASFTVLIKRNELPRALPPVFFRAGLLIDSVATSVLNNYIAVVLINHDILADFLVSAEPPSHSKWNYNTEGVSRGYDKPRAHIQFVSYSVRSILEQIASCDQQVNWDPLSDVFGIRKPEKDNGNKDGKKPGDEIDGGNDAGAEITQAEKQRIIIFSGINGAEKGVRICDGPGLANIADEKFPFKARFAVGYDTFRGLSWSPNDFDLSSNVGGVKLKVTAGTVGVEGNGNRVIVTIKDKAPFSFEIIGFDPNRDVTEENLRYDYTKQEVEDGESV